MTTGENLGTGTADSVEIAGIDADTDLTDFVVETDETAVEEQLVEGPLGAAATSSQVVRPPRHVMTDAVSIPLRRITHFNLDGSTTSTFAPIDFPSDGAF